MLPRLKAALANFERLAQSWKFWMAVSLLGAVMVPCAVVVTFWPELKGTSFPAGHELLLQDGRLCTAASCEPGVLVTGYLGTELRQRLDERIARSRGEHLWVCLLSAGGDSENNLIAPLPQNVSTCVVSAQLADGSLETSRCDSACAWVWMAGRRRELFGDAAVGFHRSWSMDSCFCDHVNWFKGVAAAWEEDRIDRRRFAADDPELAQKRSLRELAATKGRDGMVWIDSHEAIRRHLQEAPSRSALFVVDKRAAEPPL